ncbi:baseplate J/gp47 family protein [Metaclostridioides mangenotii]|uniref:baseplate J/gp47 family protein n=1 Tax=Metaclostridioides mangenotii TaxID=1540 RepID=UPI00048383FF|nr:baseplate J/gp47 family protein [Clostridioides mangenotii]
MYNEQTFEKINERTLNNVDLPVYKGEGSFLYNMLAPTNTELAQMYLELSYQFNKVMLTENYDTLLDQRASEFGYYRKQGTEATGTVEFFGTSGAAIYNGTLIEFNGLQYVTIKDFVIEENGDNTSPIQALEIGIGYNVPANSDLKLVDNISGVDKVVNKEAFSGGTEIETDDEFRDRFFMSQAETSTSGNESHYKEWAMEVEGVYNVKVVPRWDGGGTVKVVIMDKDNAPTTQEIINRCKEHIEEVRPVGVEVTVVTPSNLLVNVSAGIEVKENYTIDDVKAEFKDALNAYLRECTTEVTYMKVLGILANLSTINDCKDVLVNEATSNIKINDELVPSAGDFEFVEVDIFVNR